MGMRLGEQRKEVAEILRTTQDKIVQFVDEEDLRKCVNLRSTIEENIEKFEELNHKPDKVSLRAAADKQAKMEGYGFRIAKGVAKIRNGYKQKCYKLIAPKGYE